MEDVSSLRPAGGPLSTISASLSSSARAAPLRGRDLSSVARGRIVGFCSSKLSIQLVQLSPQERFPWEHGLVLRVERRRDRACERVLDDLVVLRRAEQDAGRRPLVRLLHVTIECLDIERELSQVRGFELLRLQLERDETERPRWKNTRSIVKSACRPGPDTRSRRSRSRDRAR